MKKQQAELDFVDSYYIEANAMPANVREVAARTGFKLARETKSEPLPRKGSAIRVVCLECSRNFSTRSYILVCPGCGGVDVELA